MKILAIDFPAGFVKMPPLAEYFTGLLSKRRHQEIDEKLVRRFDISLPKNKSYSLGLLSVASAAKAHGHDVHYFIFENNEKLQQLLNDAESFQVLLLSCKTTTLDFALDMAEQFKNKNPKIKTIFGGPHLKALPHVVAGHNFVDIVVISEGEFVVNDILNAIEKNTPLQSVEGICFKTDDGSVYTSSQAPLIDDLDSIPELDFSLLPGDTSEYHYYLESGRGCFYNCSFCANPMLWERKVRYFNPEKIYQRLRKISEVVPANTLVHIVDPSFGFSSENKTLCELLIKNPLPLKFSCDICAKHISPEIVEILYDAGMRMFCIGVESASDEVLQYNHKPAKFENIIEACRTIKQHSDAFIKTYWIIGLPGETEKSAQFSRDASINMLKDGHADLLCDHLFVPYPGCDVFHSPEKYNFNIRHQSWDQYDARSFPLPGEQSGFSMEKAYLSYLDFLRAQCEFYGLSDRPALSKMMKVITFGEHKKVLI